MLRETTFAIGGALTIALGVLLDIGLYFAAAGIEYLDAWLAGGIAVGLGAFFLYIARGEHRERLAFLRNAGAAPPEGPGSGLR